MNKKNVFEKAKSWYLKNKQFRRYFMSGSIAVLVNILIYIFLIKFFNTFYLSAATAGFFASVVVGFLLQKFWTFGNRDLKRIIKQFPAYFFFVVVNLSIDALISVFLLNYAHTGIVLSNIISNIIVIILGFYLYKHFVFRVRV